MIKLSEIDWEPIDAAKHDKYFLDKFIEPDELKLLLDDEISIIPGEKGSGKTALCKGIRLKHKDDYTGITQIRFDRIEFSPILQSLAELSSLTATDPFTYICNYWQYILIIDPIKNYFKRNKRNLSFDETMINSYLIKHGLIERNVLGTMLGLIGKCWEVMSDFTDPKKLTETKHEIMPSNLSPQIIEELSEYPIFDPEFIKIKDAFSDILRRKNEKILITLDGLDRLRTSSLLKKEGIQIVFDGLAQAVYDISISEDFAENIIIKCFFPYDRFISLPLRDLDKISEKSREIRWSYDSLQSFLAKRIQRHSKFKHLESFPNLWNEIMPEEISNKYYGISEKTYEYILRHTMYRPRQLQIHLRTLAKNYPNFVIDKSMIAKSIRESSKNLAKYYIKEYEIDHPNLGAFLKKLKGKKNIMRYKLFRRFTEETLKLFHINVNVDDKIDTLYKMSFFGLVEFLEDHHDKIETMRRYTPPRKAGIKPYHIDFHYIEPKDKVTTEIKDDDLIAIHPIFFDFCQQKPHEDLIVG